MKSARFLSITAAALSISLSAFSQSVPAAGEYLSQPLITNIYTADPAAHVFKNRIYI